MTATEIGDILGFSRQTSNELIKNGEFELLHLVGPATKPQYLVKRAEVERMKATRTFPRAKTQNP